MSDRKKIMVIAGGAWQKPLIEKIKKMGHFVLCTNLYDNTPGAMAADKCIVADVRDKEQNLKIAMGFNPDAIITDQSDIAVSTVAYVAEKLGLPGIGIETAELFTNKYRMREFEKKNNLDSIAFKKCLKYADAVEFVRKYKTAIVKPLNSQSSRGVHIVTESEGFEDKYRDASSYTYGSNEVLIEQYIEGTEFTVDGIKIGNEYRVLAISEKKHYSHNKSIASELLFMQENPKYDYIKLKDKNEALVNAMRLPFGLTHAEYKYKDGEFHLIEIAARGGGTRISSDITRYMSGLDSNISLIRYILGEKVDFEECYPKYEYSVLKFLNFDNGLVRSVWGVEEALNIPGVEVVQVDIKPGDINKSVSDDRGRHGFYIAHADKYEELLNIDRKINDLIKVEVESI